MSSAARARESVFYLPIDGLTISIDDALEEVREIETRRSDGIGRARPDAAELEQRQRLIIVKNYLLEAQALVYAYAKGPSA